MNSAPLVSFLIPMYNAAMGITETLRSIQNQTFTNYEVIIVDDGSTDGGIDLARQAMPEAVIIEKENGGIVSALNTGLPKCLGQYIARIDCFDVALPTRLASQLAILENDTTIGLVGGHVLFFDERGDIGVSRYPTDPRVIEKELLRGHSPIIHSAVTMRRDILLKIGGYDPYYEGIEDFDLFLKYSLFSKLTNVNEVVLRVLSKPSGLTFSGAHLAPLFQIALYERDQQLTKGITWKDESMRLSFAEKVAELRTTKSGPARPDLLHSRFFAMRAGLMLRSGERIGAIRDYWRSLTYRIMNLRSVIGLVTAIFMPMSIYLWILQVYKDRDHRRVQKAVKALADNVKY